MRILSARVRNYRLHGDLTVDFDPARTLIGGPNETGKSTLIEAVHRALFLKARVTGEVQTSMVSTIHRGHPEVEVEFEADGHRYLIAKRFSGTSGTTQLTQIGGPTWNGEEAERRLAELLGVEEAGGGRGIQSRIKEQWAHLWVWQGSSGTDPSGDANTQQSGLLRQLQQVGGAVAVQSDLDARVSAFFSALKGQILLHGGKAKKGSDLEKSEIELRKADEKFEEAKERRDRLETAARDVETATDTIARSGTDLERLEGDRKRVGEKLDEVERLRAVEKEKAAAQQAAAARLAALEAVEEQIAEFRGAIRETRERLDPRREEEARQAAALADAQVRAGEAGKASDGAAKSVREARLRFDLAQAWVSRFEKAGQVEQRQRRADRVRALEADIEKHQQALAGLPPIDQEFLDGLLSTETDLGKAEAALDAMAAGIEVVASPEPVQVDGTALTVGAARTVTESAEVTIGDTIRLRINPGGGTSLKSARERVNELRSSLQRMLDEYAIPTTAEAAVVLATRTDHLKQIDTARSLLDEQRSDDIDATLARAKEELIAAEAVIVRRKEQGGQGDEPATRSDAEAWMRREEALLESAVTADEEARNTREAVQAELTIQDEALAKLREDIREDERTLDGLEAQLKLLLRNHGDDAARTAALAREREAGARAAGELAETQAAIAALQPELLQADKERLDRAVASTEQQRREAELAQAAALALLRSDGSADPAADFAVAEARLEAATEHLAGVRRKADAIALVDRIFQEEQQALAEQFSQPLATKISGYLQTLFGPDARAVVSFEEQSIQGILLVRASDQGAVAFDSLSGGTREQVAAAVRLAVAELLAADYNGTLPVVFDDAFAYSDPNRVVTLQRMLDLGASRGLQVIVLTCNPSDYAALGARSVTLTGG